MGEQRPHKSLSIESPPDGGWGWVVTFSAFLVGFILDGIAYSFGLFFKELYTYFNASKSLTSWVISVLNGTYLSIGPVASVFVSLFGCRKVAIFGAILSSCSFFLCTWSPNVYVMILLYGLLGGSGLGLMYLPSLVMVGHYFKKKRALATGIAVCGSGVGGFVFAPLSELLLDLYTWRGAMWVLSAICLNGMVAGALFRPINTVTNNTDAQDINHTVQIRSGERKCAKNLNKKECCGFYSLFDLSLLKSPTFLVYGIVCFLFNLGYFIPPVYIPDHSEDSGMTTKQSSILIAIFGIVNTVGRVICGWIADRSWCDKIILKSGSVLVGGVATMFVSYYITFEMMALYSTVFGLSTAVFTTLRPVIVADLLGTEKLTSSFGLVVLCQGIASFIGAPIAGALIDRTRNYKAAFYMAGATIGLSGAICFSLRRVSKWENRRKYNIGGSPNIIPSSNTSNV